jgi:hypothetical protein
MKIIDDLVILSMSYPSNPICKEKRNMKSTKIAGLCLVAAFAVSLVASATASAAKWEQCSNENNGLTKWKNSNCTEAESGGPWNWKEVTSTERVELNGTLELKDKEVTVLGEVAVICSGTGGGSIGPAKYGRIETLKAVGCVPVKVCEAPVTAKPLGLPWQTELFETEGKKRDKITATNNGNPGWSVTCNTVLGVKTDECTTPTGKEGTPEQTNKQATGSVQATFNSSAGKAKCTMSNNKLGEAGEIIGAIQVFAAGYAIRVQ